MPYCSHMKALLAETKLKRNSMNQRRWYSLVSTFGAKSDWSPKVSMCKQDPVETALPKGSGLHCSDEKPGARFFAAFEHSHSSPLSSEFARSPFKVLFCGISTVLKRAPRNVRDQRSQDSRACVLTAYCPLFKLPAVERCQRARAAGISVALLVSQVPSHVMTLCSFTPCPHIYYTQSCHVMLI